MRADPDPDVRRAYANLVRTIRTHAGTQASSAWNTPPITSDAEMGMGGVIEALKPIEAARETCENAMAQSATPRHRRSRVIAVRTPRSDRQSEPDTVDH